MVIVAVQAQTYDALTEIRAVVGCNPLRAAVLGDILRQKVIIVDGLHFCDFDDFKVISDVRIQRFDCFKYPIK